MQPYRGEALRPTTYLRMLRVFYAAAENSYTFQKCPGVVIATPFQATNHIWRLVVTCFQDIVMEANPTYSGSLEALGRSQRFFYQRTLYGQIPEALSSAF